MGPVTTAPAMAEEGATEIEEGLVPNGVGWIVAPHFRRRRAIRAPGYHNPGSSIGGNCETQVAG
jgi:hypothetical protein